MVVSIVNTMPLQVIGYGMATAILTEIVGYLLIYRTASFKRLKKGFEKYEPPSAVVCEGGSSGKKKDAAKKKSFEAEAGRKMAVIQIVSGILTFATMIASINIVPKLFGKAPAGVLPFEPPSFIRKITQRGLEDAAPNEFSPVRIHRYLCVYPQSSMLYYAGICAVFHLHVVSRVCQGARHQGVWMGSNPQNVHVQTRFGKGFQKRIGIHIFIIITIM